MIQICNEVITIPLKLIFDQSLKKRKFPEIWKVAYVVPVHKKEGKSLVKNYCPQGQIQTTSTYANAEVTFSVVKLLKNTRIPIFSTNYFLLFFCRSKRLESLRPRFAVVILQKLSNVFACPPCGKSYLFP